MHRAPLLHLLRRYADAHRLEPMEQETAARIESLARARPDCLLRSCAPGHVTASAWIVSSDRARFLLTFHRKLRRWLQLGGHVDGEPYPHRAALREAREESGMASFAFVDARGRVRDPDVEPVVLPLDLDVHLIPARAHEPAHEHHDVRYLLIAAPDQELTISDESDDLRWFALGELERVAGDESVARLGRKAHRLLGT